MHTLWVILIHSHNTLLVSRHKRKLPSSEEEIGIRHADVLGVLPQQDELVWILLHRGYEIKGNKATGIVVNKPEKQ